MNPLAGQRSVSVVLPAHNEAGSLPQVVEQLVHELGERLQEVVVVDDGSTDRTWATITSLVENRLPVRGIRLTRNFGHQAAMLAGLHEAQGQGVIMMDADGQHPVALLPQMLAEWDAGAEIVQGLRVSNTHTPWTRRVTSRQYYRLLRWLTGLEIQPGAADFRLVDRRCLDAALSLSGPPPFLRALIPWMGWPTAYVQFTAAPRLAGETSYTWRRMSAMSLEGFVGYSALPLRLAGLLGGFLAFVAFLYLCYVLSVRVVGTGVVPGWASVAGIVAFFAGIQLLVLAAIGEYVARVFIATIHRPPYVILEQTPGFDVGA